MAKIVLIGAGSHSFSKNLITDILTYPEFSDSTVTLMDIAVEPLELAKAFAMKLVKQNKFKTKIEATTDRREALDGADYIFAAIMVGGGRLGRTGSGRAQFPVENFAGDQLQAHKLASARAAAWMKLGPDPQQPPTTFAPADTSSGIWDANSVGLKR